MSGVRIFANTDSQLVNPMALPMSRAQHEKNDSASKSHMCNKIQCNAKSLNCLIQINYVSLQEDRTSRVLEQYLEAC